MNDYELVNEFCEMAMCSRNHAPKLLGVPKHLVERASHIKPNPKLRDAITSIGRDIATKQILLVSNTKPPLSKIEHLMKLVKNHRYLKTKYCIDATDVRLGWASPRVLELVDCAIKTESELVKARAIKFLGVI